MPKVRDSQKSKVYAWEWKVLDPVYKTEYLSVPQMEKFTRRVSVEYGLRREIIVKDGRGARIARGGGYSIKMPGWTRRKPWVVIHELAHNLTSDKHGPEFVRMEIEMLARYFGASRTELVKSARASKVKVAPANKVRQPVARRTAKLPLIQSPTLPV